MHDKNNKFICPIAEFFSSGHDSQTISSFLNLVKDVLEKKMPKNSFQWSPIIVTDFSWALINAACRTFNNVTIESYIYWCADILINQQKWLFYSMSTILILCYSHFIKLIAKKIKKIKKFSSKKNNSKLHKIALYTCAVLQKSSNMQDFSFNLKNAYNIFNTKYNSKQKQNSVKALIEKIKIGSVSKDCSFNNIELDKNKSRNSIYVHNSQHNSLRKISPFKAYFEKLINQHKKNIFIKNKNKKTEINSYYCPKIFKIFFEYIHLMPLWSGVMIDAWSSMNPSIEDITNRLTNNPVENWFDQVKESLRLFLPAMPSEYADVVYNIIDAFFEQHPPIKSFELKNYQNLDRDATEKWSKNRKSIKRRKGYYNVLKDIDSFEDSFEGKI